MSSTLRSSTMLFYCQCFIVMRHPATGGSFSHSASQSRGYVQVINLRTLKPIDRDTIVKSIRKTHRVVSAEEGWPQCGIGAELIAIATEECFDDLDAPPERVTGAEVPMPYAANLEAAALPQASLSYLHALGLMLNAALPVYIMELLKRQRIGLSEA